MSVEFNREFKRRCADLLNAATPMITTEIFDQLTVTSCTVIRRLIESSAHCLTIGAAPCYEWIVVMNSLTDIFEIQEDIRRLYKDEPYYKVLRSIYDYIRNEEERIESDYHQLKIDSIARTGQLRLHDSIVWVSPDNDNNDDAGEPQAKRGREEDNENENREERPRPFPPSISSIIALDDDDDDDDDDFEPYTQVSKK